MRIDEGNLESSSSSINNTNSSRIVSATVSMHGAISIVNAIPTGKGSTMGIDLGVDVRVMMRDGSGMVMANTGDPGFIHSIVRRIIPGDLLKHKDVSIEIRSRIPMGYGLKSSSAVSNAIALACYGLMGRYTLSDDAMLINAVDLQVIDAAVSASIESGVSITGAFDDACACYFGGFFVTDNHARSILRHEMADESISAVILLPVNVKRSDPLRLRHPKLAGQFSHAVRLAEEGRYWDAMVLNGLLISSILSIPYSLVMEALDRGALAAGVSGNGPAITAVTDSESKARDIACAWYDYGEVIRSRASNEKAKVILHEG